MSNQTQLKALLVSLSFTMPRQSIKLTQEAHEIEDKAKAERGTVKTTLSYFQKQEGNKVVDALAEVKSFQNEWRSAHNKLTKPWDNNNTRLLPASLVSKYMEMTEKFKAEYPKMIEAFLDSYPEWYESAPQRLGELHNKSKFPTAQEVTSAISHAVSYLPIPAPEQIKRISDISPDVVATMQESTNEQVNKAIEQARQQAWIDLVQPLKHLASELSRPDKKKVHKSLITNIVDSLSTTKAFAETFGDNDLGKMVDKAIENIQSINPDDLKNQETKNKALDEAQKILSEFEPFYREFNLGEDEIKNEKEAP